MAVGIDKYVEVWADRLGGPENVLSAVAQPQEGRDEVEASTDRPERAVHLVSLRNRGQHVDRATRTGGNRWVNRWSHKKRQALREACLRVSGRRPEFIERGQS